jgi:hypothetical protein
MRSLVRDVAFPAPVAFSLLSSGSAQKPSDVREASAIAEEAYVYGFPMIAAYKALYQFNVDKSSLVTPSFGGRVYFPTASGFIVLQVKGAS